ncbi:Hsp33 family molecular chaperone HslO [Dyella choica]|uniref:Hsp33 family molecular chaperone HslO n=1 Tax=Dyella choica TaxID=1927959 RepID=A0A3S0WUH2_9GAMM|nr:Hsp33 family molecular chaperone HslO [Dyella choica]RUL73119.1 Hsp33 family molecular chaperone HslO [Dyella choica]
METVLAEDVLHRFVLERAGVRGVIVRLGAAWREVAGRADYPAPLLDLLGQTLAASALLTGNIKFEGALSVELKSQGVLRLLFAECTDAGRLRGLARWSAEELPEMLSLSELPQAIMAITIGQADRGQRYQGLVDLRHPDLAGALENYFQQSEQLPARFVLAANGQHAVGLMLQKLPGEGGHDAQQDEDGWPRVEHLTATLGRDELLSTPPEQLLYRLYHEETVRLFKPRPLAFGCSCSRERVEAMLRSLGREEIEATLETQQGTIEVTCEFCARTYHFDRVDAEHLLSGGAAANSTVQ